MLNVIIPTIKLEVPAKRDALKEAVAGLQATASPSDIYIIVVASGMGACDCPVHDLGIEAPNLELYPVDEALGYAEAVNRGFDCALENGADYVMVHNDDAVLTVGGWLPCLESLLSQEHIAVVGYPENPARPYPVLRVSPRHFHGAVWSCSIRTIREIGMLDEQYRIGTYEDTDYWHRCTIAGKLILMDLRFPVRHHCNMTGRMMPEFKSQEARNREQFLIKWGVDPQELYH